MITPWWLRVRVAFFTFFISCVFTACDSATVNTAPNPQDIYTDSISGRAPTLIGQPDQGLPLKSAREIEFTTSTGTALSLDVSPDGNSIVFDMLGDIYVLKTVGGTAKAITSNMALDTEPVYSPDGSKVLFLSDRSGAENLWVTDTDGLNARQISFYDDNPTFISPEWAPDGQHILVTRFWPDQNAYELWQFELHGDPLGRVLRPINKSGMKTSAIGATYAQNGAEIYFASLEDADPAFDQVLAWEIRRKDVYSGEEAVLIPANNDDGFSPKFRPLVSPDGTTLAYAERRNGKTYLMLRDLHTQTHRTLTDLDPDSLQASLWHDIVPRFDFMPDGHSVIVNKEGGIKRVSLRSGEVASIPFQAKVKQSLGALVRPQASIDQGDVQARLIQNAVLSPDRANIAFSALGRLYVKSVLTDAAPQVLGRNETREHHPSWSADGNSIAYVTWASGQGGEVHIKSMSSGTDETLDLEAGFYTHPVFVPDQSAIIVVRSPVEARQSTYMEFGQFREADLLFVPLDGGAVRVLTSGMIGGTPHFSNNESAVLVNYNEGVYSISISDGAKTLITKAVGPNWYFAQGTAPADDLRISPSGGWALAQIGHQLHIYKIPNAPNSTVNLSAATTLHKKITRAGVDYFGWSADGEVLYWTAGSSFYQVKLPDLDFKTLDQNLELNPTVIDVRFPRDMPKGKTLLRGAAVITMADQHTPSAIIQNVDVLIKGARIEAIKASGTIKEEADTRSVDVSGTYIIPGIIDAHYHIADIRRDVLDFDTWGLKANLAYGVTSLFDPSSLSIDMLTYQDLVDTGDVIGSRIFTTGPAIFDYYDFRTIDDVRAVLGRYKNNYRLSNIKQYRSGNRRVRQWIAQVSGELGLVPTTEGALSFKLDLSQIIDGYAGIEHAMPPTVHHNDLTTLFAMSGTSNNLTLMNTHGGLPALSAFINRSGLLGSSKFTSFAPDWFRESRADAAKPYAGSDYQYPAVARTGLRLRNAGGLVGLGGHGDLPGLGTHWEMQAYVEGGWSPAETLWAATMGSATAIGRNENLGSIETGKLADLVILNANPLESIENSLDVKAVMKNGRLYDGDTLAAYSAGNP
ncbi:MAG: amidohydrolase family protein [Alphaproteobacteria bacterium]